MMDRMGHFNSAYLNIATPCVFEHFGQLSPMIQKAFRYDFKFNVDQFMTCTSK